MDRNLSTLGASQTQSDPTLTESLAESEAIFDRILVAVDMGPGARRALATAFALQRKFGSEVHLFHLAEPGENEQFLAGIGGAAPAAGQDLVEESKARMLRFVDNLFPGRSADVVVHAQGGVDLVTSVRKAAERTKATMVLLGARSKQTTLRAPLEKILRELDTPVMVVWVPEDPAH